MASQAYLNLPPTSGKVVLSTTCGDIDVELWCKEAPMACRNFIQLCMEGYYDNTMFHRIIAKFMVQGGDPTGTGEGGESIYGEPFKDEIHSRLRFVHRGLVAMANGGKDDNNSQFFFTLGACDWLNGKHTIFGKITGNTIYNMDAMGAYEVDDDERPLYPPRIVTTEVLLNPFEDIVPRDLKAKVESEKDKGPKKKLKKNKALLSFGNDGDAPEEDGEETFVKKKMVSAHEALEDAKLSKEALQLPSRTNEEREEDERRARKEAGIDSDAEESEDDDDSDEEDKKKGAQRRKEQYIAVKSNKLKALERMGDDAGGEEDGEEAKEKERERRKKEMEKLKREIQGMKKGGRAVKIGEETTGTNKDVELLSGIEQKRAMFKSKRRVGAEREKDTMARLKAFTQQGVKSLTGEGKGKATEEEKTHTHIGAYGWQEALDDYDDEGWLDGGGLSFMKDSKVGFLQREMEHDDSLASYDPLADKRPKKKIKGSLEEPSMSERDSERDASSRRPESHWGERDRGDRRDRDRDRDRGDSRGDYRGGGGRDRDRDRRDSRRDDRDRDSRRYRD